MTSDIRSIAPATGSDFTRANCLNNAREASAFIGPPRFSKTCRNSRSVKHGHGTEIAVRFAVADSPAIAFDMQRKGQAIYRSGPNSRSGKGRSWGSCRGRKINRRNAVLFLYNPKKT
jgi:hypothetical protein